MTTRLQRTLLAAVGLICGTASAPAQNLSTNGLTRRNIERRAFEAVIWGMPAVNYERMLQRGSLQPTGRP